MMNAQPAGPTFREGDEVVLAKGSYQGTLGVFPHVNEDTNWADIRERNGAIRSHPVNMAGSFRDPTFQKLTSA